MMMEKNFQGNLMNFFPDDNSTVAYLIVIVLERKWEFEEIFIAQHKK